MNAVCAIYDIISGWIEANKEECIPPKVSSRTTQTIAKLYAKELDSRSEIIFIESVHKHAKAILALYGYVPTYDALQRVDPFRQVPVHGFFS